MFSLVVFLVRYSYKYTALLLPSFLFERRRKEKRKKHMGGLLCPRMKMRAEAGKPPVGFLLGWVKCVLDAGGRGTALSAHSLLTRPSAGLGRAPRRGTPHPMVCAV